MTDTEGRTDSKQKRTSNRRKQYIVDPAFQWRYAITIALTVFLITSVMSSVLYGLLHHQARMRFVYPQTYTAEVGMVVLFAALAFSAITAGGVGLWSVIATQRICGPLYVLEKHLAELASGRIPTLRPLRRKDEFKGLYRAFSRAVDGLKNQRQTELNLLTEALGRVQTAVEGDHEGQTRALELLAVQMDKIRDELAESLGVDLDGTPAAKTRTRKDVHAPVGAA